jgi:ribonuclease BN (tRNA processing enzyme)
MKIRVLGCSGAIAAGCRTTAFLVEPNVLIDAGSGVGDLSLEELTCIDHILVSHSHLDHILSIALLADAVMRERAKQGRGPITVHALPQTIAALRSHIFNGVIWPDFTRLPSLANPVLVLQPVHVGQQLVLDHKHFEVLSAVHSVPAVGFALEGPSGWWVYTGDTGPNPDLWQRLAQMKVSHLVIETAFSDEESQLARLSHHLCPTELGRELAYLAGHVNVHITHIKPGEMAAVMAQVHALTTAHNVAELTINQVITLS